MSRRTPLPASNALLLAAGLGALVLGCESNVEVPAETTTSSETSTGTATSTSPTSTSTEDPPLCGGGKGTALLGDGAHFFLLQVAKPVSVQMQLFGDLRVDPATGVVVVQLTNANRDPDSGLCPFPCDPDEVCRSFPEPECVAPSEPAGSPHEYPDFAVAADPPAGYTFTAEGCVEDTGDGTAILVTAPTTLTIVQPAVQLVDLVLTCTLALDADGVLRCTGGLTIANVKLGSSDAGASDGTVDARAIPPGEEPEGLPAPPE